MRGVGVKIRCFRQLSTSKRRTKDEGQRTNQERMFFRPSSFVLRPSSFVLPSLLGRENDPSRCRARSGDALNGVAEVELVQEPAEEPGNALRGRVLQDQQVSRLDQDVHGRVV